MKDDETKRIYVVKGFSADDARREKEIDNALHDAAGIRRFAEGCFAAAGIMFAGAGAWMLFSRQHSFTLFESAFIPFASVGAMANVLYGIMMILCAALYRIVLLRTRNRIRSARVKASELSESENIKIVFDEAGLRLTGRSSDSFIPYDDMTECREYSDGLFFRLPVKGVWVPARILSEQDAAEITGAMKYVFGKKYIKEKSLVLPEQPETALPEETVTPECAAAAEYEHCPKKSVLLQKAVRKILTSEWLMLFFFAGLTVKRAVECAGRVSEWAAFENPVVRRESAAVWLGFCVQWVQTAAFLLVSVVMAVIFIQVIREEYRGRLLICRGSIRYSFFEDCIVEAAPLWKKVIQWNEVEGVRVAAGEMTVVSRSHSSITVPSAIFRPHEQELVELVKRKLHYYENQYEK